MGGSATGRSSPDVPPWIPPNRISFSAPKQKHHTANQGCRPASTANVHRRAMLPLLVDWCIIQGQPIRIFRVPRFAANLAYLFTERPLLERFAAAAAAGFTAVELQSPYDHAPSAVKAELERHGLAMLGINTAPGQSAAGEFGVAAVPGREREFATLFKQALD